MIKGMTLSNRSNRVFMVLGLLLAVAAGALALVYLSSAKDGSGGSSATGDTPVVVAARDIEVGTTITADMLELKHVAEGEALVGVFSTPEGVVNQVATVKIVDGEQVLALKVSSSEFATEQYSGNPPLALVIPQGMRGVSVEVSSVIGAGGLIRPGNFVDVVLSVKTQGGEQGGENQVASTILQNIKVLAIDQSVTVASPESGKDETKEANETATTVTLAVTPVQTEIVALADVCRLNFDGRLSLALRPFGDTNKLGNRNEWDGSKPPDCASLLGITSLPTNFNFLP